MESLERRKVGRPATQTPEERYEKWREYMRVYMNKRYAEKIANRPPKEKKISEVKPSTKPYTPRGRRPISEEERQKRLQELDDKKVFKDCISVVSTEEKHEKSKAYFREYYAKRRDELLNKANLAYHRKIIAEKTHASQSVANSS